MPWCQSICNLHSDIPSKEALVAEEPRRNGNGTFKNILLYLTCGVSLAGTLGGVKMYRDIGVLQETRKVDALMEARLYRIESDLKNVVATVESINEDRHKRTIIIPQLQVDIAELKRLIRRPRD